MKKIPSLRLRLLVWLLLPMSAFVAICAALAWRHAASVADYVQDHDLLSSAQVLSDRLIWQDDTLSAVVPPSALSLFASPERDQVFLSVTASDGRLLAGTPHFPLPASKPAKDAVWYDAQLDGQPLRVVLIRRSMYELGGSEQVSIAVGKTPRSRDAMLLKLWWPNVGYLLLALLLAAALATLALTWELRPLMWLSRQLRGRDPLHLDLQLDAQGLHSELRPVADTLNAYTEQLREHAQAQRRFIADAAHQLRTPLALQATQIEFARYTRAHRKDEDWQDRRADMDRMWQQMHASNRRLVAVTNKLLLLAQAEQPDAGAGLEPLDLRESVLQVLEQLAALAERRGVDLGLEAEDAPYPVMAQAALLDALVSNLVDNALRYTPAGEGRVTVALLRESDGAVTMQVDDNGPGIEPGLREQVFERFFRAASDTEGTGLGLAIVREAARALGAVVALEDNPRDGRGLRVTVRLAAAAISSPAPASA
ncbi:sensor histidine kinase [Pelomonas sp. KK5]|uniref:sensor histidine kinase n=1 Tax=Pelomonas sp. KK5 TaxID=1855730 RepID=UPI0009F8E490|nr:sensor histidine kinase [Pelomonas sp. KK5]